MYLVEEEIEIGYSAYMNVHHWPTREEIEANFHKFPVDSLSVCRIVIPFRGSFSIDSHKAMENQAIETSLRHFIHDFKHFKNFPMPEHVSLKSLKVNLVFNTAPILKSHMNIQATAKIEVYYKFISRLVNA